ncbi:MAG TPA: hypothetical protein VK361_01505 [Rubrobacteraceae bacterium]|nr:hypothetical protein [Rubrobacteraceae bacterium]
MIDVSLQADPLPAYQLRGLGLFELHAEEILDAYQGGGKWLVPSGTTPGLTYEVRVSTTRPERSAGASARASHVMVIARTT